MAIKLGKVVSYSKELPHIKSHNPLNTYITTRPLAIKYDKLVTYNGTSSHKVTQPFKKIVFYDHETNQKRFISNTTMPDSSKDNKVII